MSFKHRITYTSVLRFTTSGPKEWLRCSKIKFLHVRVECLTPLKMLVKVQFDDEVVWESGARQRIIEIGDPHQFSFQPNVLSVCFFLAFGGKHNIPLWESAKFVRILECRSKMIIFNWKSIQGKSPRLTSVRIKQGAALSLLLDKALKLLYTIGQYVCQQTQWPNSIVQ